MRHAPTALGRTVILVVDPGDTTGWARFNEDGTLHDKGQSDFDSFLKFLIMNTYSRIIVEDYRLRAGKQAQQSGSRLQAEQVIGAWKLAARMADVT